MKLFTKIFLQVICMVLLLSSGIFFYTTYRWKNQIKKLEIDEEKEIERILIEFSKRVLEILPELISNLNVIANIDFIFSRGKLAYDM